MSLLWYYRPEHTQGGRNPSMHQVSSDPGQGIPGCLCSFQEEGNCSEHLPASLGGL